MYTTRTGANGKTYLELNAAQRTPEWLGARKGIVTATDVGIIMNDSNFTTRDELRHNKRNNIVPVVNADMQRGADKEDEGLVKYTKLTGNKVRMMSLCVDIEIPQLGASPDGMVVDEFGNDTGKLFEQKSRRKLYQTIFKTDMWQVLTQMYVTGSTSCDYFQHSETEYRLVNIPWNEESWKLARPNILEFIGEL